MTEKEGLTLLRQYVNAEQGRGGWWIFNDKNLSFTKTRLLKPYEREANLPLPASLQLEKVIFDHSGATIHSIPYQWKDMVATGIKTDPVIVIRKYRYDEYFLCCLQTGEVIEVFLGDITHLYGQLGHFIEQYKGSGPVNNR